MTRSGKRRLFIGLFIGLVGVLILVLFVVTPALAVRNLIQAVETGDKAGIERGVDFPAFRESLKGELNTRMRAELRDRFEEEDEGLGALGILLAPTLVDGAVDAFVTPQAIAAMVQTADAPGAADGPRTPRADEPHDDIRRRYGYRGLNTVVLTLIDPDQPDEPLHLLLERRNLIGWKLAGVDIADRPRVRPAT